MHIFIKKYESACICMCVFVGVTNMYTLFHEPLLIMKFLLKVTPQDSS